MSNIAVCTQCDGLYEAGSDEQAAEKGNVCRRCSGEAEKRNPPKSTEPVFRVGLKLGPNWPKDQK